MLRNGNKYLLMLVSIIMLTACISQSRTSFIPPQDRESLLAEQPWPHNGFVAISWHNVEDEAADQRFMSVRTSALREQFAWLRENGYQPVSIAQIREAHRGGKPLPEKAVVLTFDDGYQSFYTRVFPILQAFQWPAVWAPVGSWVDTPADKQVKFGDELVDREYFATWQQVREVARSRLVELASHTWNSHYGIQANATGSLLPVYVNRAYFTDHARYETAAEYRERIRLDAVKMTEYLRTKVEVNPHVFVWPYGEANGIAIEELKKLGYDMFFTLESGLANASQLDSIPRVLIANNPSLKEFAQQIITVQACSVRWQSAERTQSSLPNRTIPTISSSSKRSSASLNPEHTPRGKSHCVISPLTITVTFSPRRVKNIFICAAVTFCASSRMTTAFSKVRPRI